MAITAVNLDLRIEYFNPVAERLYGYKNEDVIGKTVLDLHKIENVENSKVMTVLEKISKEGEHLFTIKRTINNGIIYLESRVSGIWDDKKNLIGYVLMSRDITEKKQSQEQLKYLAHFDSLTNIPNRTLFNDRLVNSIAQAKRTGRKLALLFIDLDRFKKINDTLGHDRGDMLLKEAAQRLIKCIRESDTVARMGGDEFTVLLSNIVNSEDVSLVACKIISSLSSPFMLKGHECSIGASIGISIFPTDTSDAAILLKNADISMYKAKEQGRNNFQFYSSSMDKGALYRLKIENLMRKAIEKEELTICYQPQVAINSGKLKALEASIRWENEELGVVSPNDFIPIAIETGLIVPIGQWMLINVCKQGRIWLDEGFCDILLAVKILYSQFKQKNLVEIIENILEDTNFPASNLEIEITETTMMENMDESIDILKSLKKLGLHITIDDFGTGYSSLSHLKRLPINTLKIDKQFVINIATDPDYAEIASAIIALAHSLRLRVIAEGVETLHQLEYLRSVKCDEVQGEVFSPPLTAANIKHILIDEKFSI
ncbi:signaling protein [Candidatus Magnetoovum chiemensis]|nr:signaling protein [Candidatus Magnetoovum chiemensis]